MPRENVVVAYVVAIVGVERDGAVRPPTVEDLGHGKSLRPDWPIVTVYHIWVLKSRVISRRTLVL